MNRIGSDRVCACSCNNAMKNEIKYEIKMCRLPTHTHFTVIDLWLCIYESILLQIYSSFCCNGDFISQCDLFDLREHLTVGIWFMAFAITTQCLHLILMGMLQVNKQIYVHGTSTRSHLPGDRCVFLHFTYIDQKCYSVGVKYILFFNCKCDKIKCKWRIEHCERI